MQTSASSLSVDSVESGMMTCEDFVLVGDRLTKIEDMLSGALSINALDKRIYRLSVEFTENVEICSVVTKHLVTETSDLILIESLETKVTPSVIFEGSLLRRRRRLLQL